MERLRGRQKHGVDYRHIIDWLVRKPGAFAHYRYRDELFPTSRFRMAFDVLQERLGAGASREYLRILELAAKESEAKVEAALDQLLGGKAEKMTAKAVEAIVRRERATALPPIQVAAVDLGLFDELYQQVHERGAGSTDGTGGSPERTASAHYEGVLRREREAGGERDLEL